ncbi:beta-propeller fold lactonase family protein [Burkholderia sp. WSM2232]|nr:beta-propeller fold lactonase family protein [Burkholderia sp. WSM2232]
MLVANQGSGNVKVLGIDTAFGKLFDGGQTVSVPTPVSIAFVK